MKADPSAQVRLLDLQDLDSRADQLRHQRRSLPEHARLAELADAPDRLDDQARDARIAVDDLAAEQAKVDADVEQVKTRRERDQQRIDQGLVSNPKDIQRMQQEMVSLERRITSLEDDEIEVMERLEEAQRTLDALTAQLTDTDERIAELDAARATPGSPRSTQALGELDGAARPGRRRSCRPTCWRSTTGCARARTASAPRCCAPGSCGGCMLDLDNAELATIRGGGRRRGDPVRGVQPDPGPHLRERACERCDRADRAGRHRGRRRLARQPRPRGVRRAGQGRRHRRGCSPRTAPPSGSPATTSRSTAA